jgi:hypothetical protein
MSRTAGLAAWHPPTERSSRSTASVYPAIVVLSIGVSSLPSGSVGKEVVGVDEHQIAGVRLNRPPAGRGDVAVTEINGLARQFTEILHDHPRTLSVGARIDAHAHVHR